MGTPENKTPARDGARTGADFKVRDGLAHPEYSDRPWIIPPGATNADVASPDYGLMTPSATARFCEAVEALRAACERDDLELIRSFDGPFQFHMAMLEAGRTAYVRRLFPQEILAWWPDACACTVASYVENGAVIVPPMPDKLCLIWAGPGPLPRTDAEAQAEFAALMAAARKDLGALQ